MEENNKLDKAAKSAFDNFRMNPPDAAWDRIESELDRKQSVIYKKKAERFRYISAALALLLFSIIGWNLLQSPEEINSGTANNTVKSNELKVNNNIASINNIKTDEAGQGIAQNKTSNNIANTNSAPSPVNQYDVVHNSALEPTSVSSEAHQSTSIPNELISEVNNASLNNSSYENHHTQPQSSNQGFVYINYLSSIEPDLIQNVEESQIVPAAAFDTALLVKHEPNSKLALGIYFTPEYKWQHLKDQTNNNFDDVSMYKDRETCMFSYSLGITANYSLNQHWSITSGLNYSKFAKDISIPVMYAKMNSDNEMYFEYSTSNGNIDIPIDQSHTYMNPGDSIVTDTDCTHLIKSVSVPLLVRYTIQNKKFNYYIEGGIYAGYNIQSKANFNYDIYNPTVINNTTGLQNFNLEFSAGIGIQYGISNSTKIFTEPVLKGSITSLTKNTAVNSYPYSVGLKLGIVQKF